MTVSNTKVLREAAEALRKAHALVFFEEKHHAFLLHVEPVWVNTGEPEITFLSSDADEVAGHFGNTDWVPRDNGKTRSKIVDLVRVNVGGMPELATEPRYVNLVSQEYKQPLAEVLR